MKRTFHHSLPAFITIIFALCAVILIGNAISLYNNLLSLRNTNSWIEHSWDVKDRLKNVNVLIMDAESSLRGYYLSGNKIYLGPWQTAQEKIEPEFKAMAELLKDNPVQSKSLAELKTLFDKKMQLMKEGLAAFNDGGLEQIVMLAKTAEGRSTMDEIRLQVIIMEREENALLAARSGSFYQRYQIAMAVGMAINIIALLVLILFYQLIARSFFKRLAAERELKASNEHLEARVLERTEQLSILSRHLINVSEQEKAKLARELHDELGSNLTVLAMDISMVTEKLRQIQPELAERLQRASATIKTTIGLKRRIIENLRPSILDTMGLAASLMEQASEFEKFSNLRVNTDITEDFDKIDPSMAIALFRIAQEALTNVAKYAQATQVWISLQAADQGLRLRIADDGIGIAAEALKKSKAHGVIGMRERMLLLGGNLTVAPAANGRGTVVDAHLPLNRPATQADAPAAG
ncbi:histidine kinase-, DNA gyrase B-, and HSP90-like ATPase family protein [Collimonas fungivorans]|uniref:Histidine kinase-, DNA gyrase B-, and HSP90-like ATPase family protein n=1 Tax=Collimonas fungivorans TaxID=158899 RepID=A0A127PFY5_9BURK|nr:CHASE3 domain-containing protein [Collimonas fungivorans]AMO96544.1 histidine kinase-, DNA gyrase B-, and HSP90-like ATPase family protein [Collimonas fungivorans]